MEKVSNWYLNKIWKHASKRNFGRLILELMQNFWLKSHFSLFILAGRGVEADGKDVLIKGSYLGEDLQSLAVLF